jgi:hypothetical protein
MSHGVIVMNANQFVVSEHASYDMIWTWFNMVYSHYPHWDDDLLRMNDAMEGVVTLHFCRFFVFPDYEFGS